MNWEEVHKVFDEFEHLLKKESTQGRVSYYYKHSLQRGQEVAREIKQNKDGSVNGYLSSKYMSESTKKKYEDSLDARDFIKMKNFSKDRLREGIQDVMRTMSNEEINTKTPIELITK